MQGASVRCIRAPKNGGSSAHVGSSGGAQQQAHQKVNSVAMLAKGGIEGEGNEREDVYLDFIVEGTVSTQAASINIYMSFHN